MRNWSCHSAWADWSRPTKTQGTPVANRSPSSSAARPHIRQLGKDNVTAPRALALSDKQLALLQRAAASLPVGERDHFLQSVAAHLSGQPTDDAVIAANQRRARCCRG